LGNGVDSFFLGFILGQVFFAAIVGGVARGMIKVKGDFVFQTVAFDDHLGFVHKDVSLGEG
jgi:hypothetical protein